MTYLCVIIAQTLLDPQPPQNLSISLNFHPHPVQNLANSLFKDFYGIL